MGSRATEARAKLIARQETMTALATGQFDMMKAAGATTKTWHHRDQKDPRDGKDGKVDHIQWEGTTVGIDEKFPNGLRFPRDPEDGRAEEVINCRCYLTYGFDADEGLKPAAQDDIMEADDDGVQTGGRIVDPEGQRGQAFADLYYEEIRHFTTDVERIAQNIGKSKEDIQKIKNYLFLDNSLYDEGVWRRFDTDCAIAQSWQRLMIGKDIKPHDLTLIEHELLEMRIKEDNPGISHSEAHTMAQQVHNYTKGSKEYYDSLEKHKKDK